MTARPFLQACRGELPDRLPVWLMRQAGRYLPEYRAVREKVSFEELCRNPELACEVTMQPIRRYDFDAAIIFSDILVVSDALGCPVRFPTGGPVVDNPIRSRAAIDALLEPEVEEALGFVLEAHKLVRAALPARTALIGFAGGPVTVASYMTEGGASKSFGKLKNLILGSPDDGAELLRRIARLTARYLRAQVAAGADAVQVFDTWASVFSREDYARAIAPCLRELFAELADLGVPRIYFTQGGSHLLPEIASLGADVIGVDWRIPIDQARSIIGRPDHPVQGNLDPALLLCDEATLRRRVRSTVDAVSEPRGYIFNLGHGVIKDTSPDNVAALVEELRTPRGAR